MTETPKYITLKKERNIELRQYNGYIQAEVQVTSSNYNSAINKGFGTLAGFIFGDNIKRQKIEMTTPVQASQSEKIAMTSPVTVSGVGTYTVAFIMPAGYTLDTLPQPRDGSIRFREVPARRVAAIRFSGYFNEGSIEKHGEELRRWLSAQNLVPEGDMVVAGYDPPWVPWFLARNELWCKIIDETIEAKQR
jgi:hypothetical protein